MQSAVNSLSQFFFGCSRVCVFPAGFGSNFRIMVGSASGPGSTFKAFLGSAQVRVPLSNKIRVRVSSVQRIYGSLRVRVRILGPVKTSSPHCPNLYLVPSGSRTRDSHAGGGRSNKERQRLQPLASVARAPLFEVRGVRFTHSPYWHTSVTRACTIAGSAEVRIEGA